MRKINTLHYKALRIAVKDWERIIPKEMLDLLGRSLPMDFCNYSLASLLIKICNNKEPKKLHQSLAANEYRCRRKPSNLRLFDSSKKKIGKQMFRNRIDDIEPAGRP